MKIGHRPALDGIRGLAVLLVVSGHSFGWPPGGWLGVDLFFVLSGFLITVLLLEEHAATGAITILGFYGRRARRLLPALLLLLGVYASIEAIAGTSPVRTVLVALFYVMNFAVELGSLTPISHLWSLAQEEQFYLVWPFALTLLLRRAAGVLPLTLAGFIVVEWTYRAGIAANPPWGFYDPMTRSDGLAIGCLFAVLWFRNRATVARACRALTLVGLPFAAAIILTVRSSTVGEAILLPFMYLFFAAVIVDGVERVRSPLAAKPLRQVGRISYSLYLWHVPVLYALGTGNLRGFHPWVSVAAVACSLVIASLSTVLIEEPVRRRARKRRPERPSASLSPAANVG